VRLDIADLQLFLSVVDAGSITRGAAEANLALASASERLRRIESDAGVALLQRRSRGVTTTAAGDALVNHARLILHQQAQMRGKLRSFATGARATLRLYANTAALAEFVPRRLAPWLAHHPSVHVELKERTSVDIVRAVRAGLAEAGIVSDAVAPVGVHPQPVAKSDLVVIAPAEHRLAGRLTTRLADVVGEAFVGMAPGTAMQKYLDEKACATGHSLRMRVQIKTFEGICEMVSHGIGLGIIPKEVARRNQRRHGYRICI
jgi:DNA-binding transcriptional LysR family regulator